MGRKTFGDQTLWTIQRVQVWHKLIRDKSLHAPVSFVEPNFLPAYDWMVAQMKNRIRNYEGRYPWWAYEQRPDIRHHTDEAGFYVLLQLGLDPARVLLSSYGAWHCVLNDWFFVYPANSDESDEKPTATQSEKERSWESIFNVKSLRPYDTIQATFETLRLEDIVRYSLFEVTD